MLEGDVAYSAAHGAGQHGMDYVQDGTAYEEEEGGEESDEGHGDGADGQHRHHAGVEDNEVVEVVMEEGALPNPELPDPEDRVAALDEMRENVRIYFTTRADIKSAQEEVRGMRKRMVEAEAKILKYLIDNQVKHMVVSGGKRIYVKRAIKKKGINKDCIKKALGQSGHNVVQIDSLIGAMESAREQKEVVSLLATREKVREVKT